MIVKTGCGTDGALHSTSYCKVIICRNKILRFNVYILLCDCDAQWTLHLEEEVNKSWQKNFFIYIYRCKHWSVWLWISRVLGDTIHLKWIKDLPVREGGVVRGGVGGHAGGLPVGGDGPRPGRRVEVEAGLGGAGAWR